jgi:hypothetical protein
MKIFPLLGSTLATGLLAFAVATPAFAQDLGSQWVDRIGSELRAEKTAHEGGQFTYGAEGGVLFAYDSNIFLTEKNHQGEAIWIPYARARAGYSEPQFEVAADLEADYKHYVETQKARNDDERFFGKIGYSGSIVGGSIIQFVRNESDPIDALFAERVDRVVTDTLPRFYWDITPKFAFEIEGVLQVVHFQEDSIGDARDNVNARVVASLVWKEGPLKLDYLVQGGAMWISYQNDKDALGNPTAPPNVDGWLARAGVRGEVRPDLYVEGFAGVVGVRTDQFKFGNGTTRKGDALNTMDMSFFARYKAIDRVILSAGYSRLVVFGFSADPFQVINRAQVLGEFAAMEHLSVQAHAQFDVANSDEGVKRNYGSFGVTGAWTLLEHVVVDGGVTYRVGKIYGDVASNQDYNDFIVQVGVGIAW